MAYSYDLRLRIHDYSLTHTLCETAKNFSVCPSTVYLYGKLFKETGSLEPRYYSYIHHHLITTEGEAFICKLLTDEVDLTLDDIRYRYDSAFGILVSVGTMFNTLNNLNFSRKKKTFSDPKKSTGEVKEKYFEKLETIAPEKRFYLDETGACLNMTPIYGRSYMGERVYDERPTNPGTRVNTAAVLTTDGIKAQYSYTGSLNAKIFIFYLATFVLPIITAGETIIMDNHPVHHAKGVLEFLNNNNIKFLFLPTYSPELNPIEEAFSKSKQYIKKMKARSSELLLKAIKESLSIITKNDVIGYFNHAAQF